MNSVFLQITSGRGPAECAWVVARLVEALILEAKKTGVAAELIEQEPGAQKGTLLSMNDLNSGTADGLWNV
ncbi:MAG: hypothetical protein EHM45_07935 [Desulfobacteraceae bacterium]|nr:MAG: hypothetical protein EHM45_07935 [Desulfobacteraceae bacterium]